MFHLDDSVWIEKEKAYGVIFAIAFKNPVYSVELDNGDIIDCHEDEMELCN